MKSSTQHALIAPKPRGEGGTPDTSAIITGPMVAPAPAPGAQLVRGGTASGQLGVIVSAANRWRENYNPLRNLIMRRAVELFELAQRGDTAYLQWTYRFVEETYPTLSALISRCEAPLANFEWTVEATPDDQIPEGCAKAQAQNQARHLRAAYRRIDNLKEALRHLHLAEFRGYAHLQKHRAQGGPDDGAVTHLECLNQWCVCRDGQEGNWWWNPDSRSTSAPLAFLGPAFCIGGPILPRADFIIHTSPRPIDRIAMIAFVRHNMCEKDWDGFIEIYGVPSGVVEMPPNVPQAKEQEYETSARRVAEGGSGAIPNGAKYQANDSPRGTDPFSPRLKRLDEQVILAGTGGKLTMLAESGSGTLAASAHSDTFEDLAAARAQRISESFQRDFDRVEIEQNFPGQPVMARFWLRARTETDKAAFVKDVGVLSQAGYKVKPDHIEEVTGYELSEEPPIRENIREDLDPATGKPSYSSSSSSSSSKSPAQPGPPDTRHPTPDTLRNRNTPYAIPTPPSAIPKS